MSSYQKAKSLVFMMLVVVLGAAIAALHSRGQNSLTMQDEPTLVQRGHLSEKQKEHSKLFKNKGAGNIHDLIQKEVANGGGGEITIEALPGLAELNPSGEANPAANQLITSAAQADAVVIGMVTAKTSQLNATETFIFTDYDVNVVEVLKNNSVAPIDTNCAITVTRSGGTVQLEGHVVRAIDRTAKPLIVGGKYLLFLRYLSNTGAYLAAEGPSSFKLDGGKVVTLTDDPRYSNFQKEKGVVSFVNEVHAAIAASYERKERNHE